MMNNELFMICFGCCDEDVCRKLAFYLGGTCVEKAINLSIPFVSRLDVQHHELNANVGVISVVVYSASGSVNLQNKQTKVFITEKRLIL